MDMKSILNMHALNSLLCPVDMPAESLGVAHDEELGSVPLLLFTEQHLPVVQPEMIPINQMSYEKVQRAGTGSSLALEDFETQAFSMGGSYGGVN